MSTHVRLYPYLAMDKAILPNTDGISKIADPFSTPRTSITNAASLADHSSGIALSHISQFIPVKKVSNQLSDTVAAIGYLLNIDHHYIFKNAGLPETRTLSI